MFNSHPLLNPLMYLVHLVHLGSIYKSLIALLLGYQAQSPHAVIDLRSRHPAFDNTDVDKMATSLVL